MKPHRWDEYWNNMPEIEPWEAVALALNIDPESLGSDPFPRSGPYAYPAPNAVRRSMSILLADEFRQRMRILVMYISRGHFSKCVHKENVPLDEFATWCIDIVKWEIPEELRALAKLKAHPIPVAPEEASQSVMTHAEAETTGENEESDADQELAKLFDPMRVEALEKMFPAHGKWKKWTAKAKQNGLKKAREARAQYNPYYAAKWFVSRGNDGWDLARCCRVLENNLPARSRDKAYLLAYYQD